MSRLLTAELDALTGPAAERRRPDYRIEIFDIRSTAGDAAPTRINNVVLFNLGLGLGLPAIVGPRDFTADCPIIDVTEVAGDYTQNGVAATQLQLQIVDPDQTFDPLENPAPASGRWLRQGNVVVVREGDAEVPVADWPITFTGAIQGQPGQSSNRTTGQSFLTVAAQSREVDFLRRISTTREFVQGESLQDVAREIAEVDMGLDADEINFSTFSARLTVFRSTQLAEESPLVSIAKVMFADGFMPRFGGDGRLTNTNGIITKAPIRTYSSSLTQLTIVRPIVRADGINEVEILGLDPTKEQIVQQRQELARAAITTGFFGRDTKIPVRWSEDKTQQALDPQLEVLSSIGDGIFNFGGESFTNFPLSDGGSIEGEINVDGALAQSIVLLSLIFGIWLIAARSPDAAPQAPSGVLPTQPIGRLVEAAAGKAIFIILGTVGRGEYRITGRPYEYIFREIRCVARVSGLRSEDVKSVTIQNHLINSASDCDAVAERVLLRERAKQNRRQITMLHDLRLEPDDVFAAGSGTSERRYAIQSVKRRLERGGTGAASYDCFEVTAGVRP